jgi:uncharacterized protein YggE
MKFVPPLALATLVSTNVAQAQFVAPPANAIMVSTEASIETAPDVAELSVTLRGEGKTPDQATRALADRVKAVSDGLRTLDRTAEVRTGSVAIGEVRAGDCRRSSSLPLGIGDRIESIELAADALAAASVDDLPSPQQTSARPGDPCALIGYVARSEASVLMRSVKDAGTAVGLAGRLGAASASIERFDVTDQKDAQRRAATAAVAKARLQAEAIAVASGARLGAIISVSDSLDRELMNYAMQANMPAPPVVAMEVPVPVEITPRPVSTSSRLTLTFALVR